MREYPKINSMFKRDMSKPNRPLIVGDWATPELEYLSKCDWDFTEKVDGTNVRVMFVNGEVKFGGRTDSAQMPTQLLRALEDIFLPRIDALRNVFNEDACLYGEGYGAKIQKGGGNYKSDGNGFVLFDVLIGNVWLKRSSVVDIAVQLGIEFVPSVGSGTLYDALDLVGRGFRSRWGDFTAEGIVARPEVDLFDRLGHRIITKAKCADVYV